MQFSQRQLLIVGAAIAGAIILLFVVAAGLKPDKNKSQQIVIWGLLDDPELFPSLAEAYLQETGNSLVYVQKNPDTYEQELLDALASGNGPDIFFFKNNWLLRHYNKVRVAPQNLFTASAIQENYPQAVSRDFVSGDNVYAVPMFIDTLALFYNQDLLDQAAVPFPPKTWEELVEVTPKLTRINERRDILYSGIALGTADNVSHATDILSLLMIQAGSNIVDDQFTITFQRTKAGIESLNFYTQFAKPKNKTYAWNDNFNDSIEEFAKGKVSLVIGYASDIPKIRAMAPYFNFKIAPMPQPQDATLRKDYASYWGLAVNKQSKKSEAAWNLISYLSQNSQAEAFQRKTMLPPAKRLLLNQVKDQPLMDVFSKQAYTAVSWPQPDSNLIDKIFKNGISDAVSEKKPLDSIVAEMANQIDEIFKKAF